MSWMDDVDVSNLSCGLMKNRKGCRRLRINMRNKKILPIHPDEVLMEEFLKPMGVSQYRLAKDISVPPRRINEIVHGDRRITADTALRLGRYFGVSPQFWLNLWPGFLTGGFRLWEIRFCRK